MHSVKVHFSTVYSTHYSLTAQIFFISGPPLSDCRLMQRGLQMDDRICPTASICFKWPYLCWTKWNLSEIYQQIMCSGTESWHTDLSVHQSHFPTGFNYQGILPDLMFPYPAGSGIGKENPRLALFSLFAVDHHFVSNIIHPSFT